MIRDFDLYSISNDSLIYILGAKKCSLLVYQLLGYKNLTDGLVIKNSDTDLESVLKTKRELIKSNKYLILDRLPIDKTNAIKEIVNKQLFTVAIMSDLRCSCYFDYIFISDINTMDSCFPHLFEDRKEFEKIFKNKDYIVINSFTHDIYKFSSFKKLLNEITHVSLLPPNVSELKVLKDGGFSFKEMMEDVRSLLS